MTHKSIKIINLTNLILSAVALILECMPNSVIKYKLLNGEYVLVSYHSYFASPSVWNNTLMVAFIFAILTIVVLLLNLALLIKNNKSLYIASTILTSLTALISPIFGTYATAFNILIMALFVIQSINRFVGIFYNDKKSVNAIKRIELLNVFNIVALTSILILEMIPNSMQIVNKFNISASKISQAGLSYVYYANGNTLSIMAFVVAVITFNLLLFGLTILSVDKKGLCITQLSLSSLCLLSSIIICIMAGSQVTIYNIIITILFAVPVIILSIKLKFNYKDNQIQI